MNYSSYLFNNLLKEFSAYHSELPYDEMYDAHTDLMIKFEKSEYNTSEKSEYHCICDFLKNENL